MPDPNSLRVGDRVRFVSLHEEWQQPGYTIHRDTIAFMKRMIRRKFSSRIASIEHGRPWIEARIRERGRIRHHSYAICEQTGWRQVKSR